MLKSLNMRRLTPWLLFLLLTTVFVLLQTLNGEPPDAIPGVEDMSLSEAQVSSTSGITRDAQSFMPPSQLEPASMPVATVMVKTDSGSVLSGRLLIARPAGEPLQLTIGEKPTPIPVNEFDNDALRQLIPSHFLVVPVTGSLVRGSGIRFEGSEQERTAITVTVPDGFPVKIQVLDHHQTPVVGARIIPFDRFPLPGAEEITLLASNEDGSVSFTAYDLDAAIRVRIVARGFGMETIDIRADQADRVIELDRMLGVGVVLDNRFDTSHSATGMRGPLVFAGYRNADWTGLIHDYVETLGLGEGEYIDWTINMESGEWKEPDPITLQFRGKDGQSRSTTVWMRAFTDPKFTIYHLPQEIRDALPELVPLRFHLGPAQAFPAGYPEEFNMTLVPSGQEIPAGQGESWMFGDGPPPRKAVHVGGGRYEVWVEPGEYQVAPNTWDFSPAHRHPVFVPGQHVVVGSDGGISDLMLADQEAYIGVRVLDPDGFLLDASWLLVPQEERNPSFLGRPRGELSKRFIHQGTWKIVAMDASFSMKPWLLAEGITWPQALHPGGILTIRLDRNDALEGSLVFY